MHFSPFFTIFRSSVPQNASRLKDGTVLKLCSSPVGAADELVTLLGAWATKAPEHSAILKRLENEACGHVISSLPLLAFPLSRRV